MGCEEITKLNREKQASLLEKHKWIGKPRCGISIPLGWYDLVDRLCSKIEKISTNGVTIEQIKEKFAGLRFYFSPTDKATSEAVTALVCEAEIESNTICMQCGKPGKEKMYGFRVSILCSDCEKIKESEDR